MAVRRKFIALATVLLISSATILAADTKGWYDNCCDLTEFHFTRFPGSASGEELQVRLVRGRLPLVEVPDTWWGTVGKVTGRRCNHAGNCVEAIKADLQVLKVTKKYVSGKYIADFNGRNLEGQFTVKYRKKRPVCICE